MTQDTPQDPTRNLGLATAEFMDTLVTMLQPGQRVGEVVIIGEIYWPNEAGGHNSTVAVHFSNREPLVTGLIERARHIVRRRFSGDA